MGLEGWQEQPPPSMTGSFESGGEYEIRVGKSLYGARSFAATPEGWLTGVTFRKIWSPGVNVAGCYKVTGWDMPGIGRLARRPWRPGIRVIEGPHDAVGRPPWKYLDEWRWETPDGRQGISQVPADPVYGNLVEGHDLVPCGCGFHGYYRGSLDFAYDAKVVNGVVRAFGRMRLGTKGFRASHAEIVALYVPEKAPGVRNQRSEFGNLGDGLRRASAPLEIDLMKAISGNYPQVPIYRDLDEMLLFHPTEEPS